MKLDYLANKPNLIPLLAKWYFEEWGQYVPEVTLDSEITRLKTCLHTNDIPMVMIALEGDQLIGAAQIKYHEMSQFPEKEHWLGSVYTSGEHRGKGIAQQIILALLDKAKMLDIPTLFLQTERLDGGLYQKMGWSPVIRTQNHRIEVLVMERHI